MGELHSGNSALPEQTRALIRALEAQHGDSFQSARFLKPGAGGDSKQEFQIWREAWRNPMTNKWELTEHATMPDFYEGPDFYESKGGIGVAERRQTLRSDLCFFDAVYQCALFEVSERKFGHAGLRSDPDAEQPHYAIFAAAEGVPLDKSGMPLLAAFGRILSDGDYDEAARKIAARSASDLKLNAAPQSAVFNAPAFTTDLPAVISSANDLVVQRGRMEAQARAEKIDKRLAAVVDSLENCRKNGFKNNFGEAALIGAIPVLGQLFLLAALLNASDFYEILAPNNIFKGSLRKLKKEYNALSGFVDAVPFEQFEQDALMTYHVLAARDGARAFVTGGKQKKLDKCLAAFRKAAVAHGWSEERAEQMLALIRKDAESRHFDDTLVSKLKESKDKIVQYMQSAAAPAPQEQLKITAVRP